ncbi:MAG: glycosyltransferase [Thermoflexales bacterium]|nr:glycosyltransferase [Thermoflexales bacterium]
MHIAIGYRWFPTAAGYHIERALQALGHKVTYIGLPCSQRAGYDTTVPVDEIVAALPEKPDFYLWIDPAGRYFPPGIERLPIPTACYLIDVHLGTWREQAARFFDAVFIAQKDYLERFRRAVGHEQVYWLPLAAAPDVHYDHGLPRIYEVGFVGNIARAHRRTPRARRLRRIAERFRTNDFDRIYSPEEVGRVYSQSRIVFNCSIAGDVTMRIFEGAACGALVLTDSVANGLEELFEIGREIVVYRDDADLMEKIAYYLAHEEEREAIARAGQQRTLREHTYLHRMRKLVEIVSDPGFRSLAPMRTAPPAERWRARRKVQIHLHMLDALLDEARERGLHPIQRAWVILPALLRRLIL